MDFKELTVWKKSMNLAKSIYSVTTHFPKEEIYGITSQLRRAVISVALNIAEGYGRYHFKDKCLFFYNSRASLLEVKSLVMICFRLEFLKEGDKEKLISEIDNLGIKINNFISYLKKKK